MTTERIGPPLRAGERETLRAFPDFHRVVHHLCHEYPRHNGHANFLREGIEGVTGA